MPKASLKAVYSISELADLMGVDYWKARRMILASGVPFRRSGRAIEISLSAFKRAFPEEWESILDLQHLR